MKEILDNRYVKWIMKIVILIVGLLAVDIILKSFLDEGLANNIFCIFVVGVIMINYAIIRNKN